jgi:hypothetical protein
MAVGGGGGGTVANLQVQVGANVAGALLGFQTLQGAISAVVDTVKQFVSSGIEMNSFLESSELQFKTLTGSATAAHDKVSELFDLAAHTPFTFESVTVAARQLEVFGGAALDTEANLRMLGDSAAATAAPIEQVTFWTGRLYSALQAGEPIGMATMWLQRMGVLSAEATRRMKALSDAGASADEVWKAFADSQQRFSGAMKEQEGTWKGLTSTMSDTLTLLTGEATHAGFVRLEGDIKKVNVALADPSGHQGAAALGQAFDALVRAGETAGSGFDVAVVQPLGRVGDAVDDVNRLAHLTGDQWSVIFGNDMPAALAVLSAALERVPEPLGAMESSGIRIASVMEASNAEFAKAPPLIDQVRDSWASAAQEADHLAQAARNLVLERAKSPDLGGGDSATRAADQAAHDAEMQRLYDEGQALAHAGDISQIVAREQISARQFATQQAEKAAKDAQKAQEEAAREAARVITEQNRAAQEQIRQQTQAAQEAVRRAYVETADEAVAQYQRIANATPAPVDTLQQQIDEATNRQVRAGTQGTADAEKQLDDIRKAHLAILPDLVALDKQYADAQRDSHAADVAVAAAERDLQKALAATGGTQTLQTAALAHGVTAAKQAADAAHDHAAALSAERSQAISDTNALKGVADQRKAMADDAASRQIGGMPGGGAWQPGMGGGGGDNTAHIDPSYWTRNLSALDPRNILQPTIVTHVNFNAPVTTTQGDFQQSVVNAVQQADRQNGLNLTRYAPR